MCIFDFLSDVMVKIRYFFLSKRKINVVAYVQNNKIQRILSDHPRMLNITTVRMNQLSSDVMDVHYIRNNRDVVLIDKIEASRPEECDQEEFEHLATDYYKDLQI